MYCFSVAFWCQPRNKCDNVNCWTHALFFSRVLVAILKIKADFEKWYMKIKTLLLHGRNHAEQCLKSCHV